MSHNARTTNTNLQVAAVVAEYFALLGALIAFTASPSVALALLVLVFGALIAVTADA